MKNGPIGLLLHSAGSWTSFKLPLPASVLEDWRRFMATF